MMFIWGEPLNVKEAADIFDIDKDDAYALLKELQNEYAQEGRGIRIREVNKSFQFVTLHENEEYIEKLCTPVKVKKLSQAALEVLAIIAYKQPITKSEIDAIRGIKCDRVIDGLLNKELIEVRGRSEKIGRPLIYGTTDEFLKKFGFENIKELPEIEDLEDTINENKINGIPELHEQIEMEI